MKRIILVSTLVLLILSIVAISFTVSKRQQTTASRASETTTQNTVATTGQTIAMTSTSFLETFDGAPSSPQPYKTYPGSDKWDTFISFRDFRYPDSTAAIPFPPVDAHHGPNCEKPIDVNGNLVTHRITSGVQNHVFICNNHMMTSINGGEYGAIYMMPNHMVNFSEGEAVIRFDMTTLRTSGRDWVDFWITPFENQLLAPLEKWRPDFNGEPKEGIQIVMDSAGSSSPFRTEFRGRKITNWGYPNVITINTTAPQLENYVTTDPARRDTWEIRISKTRLKFSLFINRGTPVALDATPDLVFFNDPIPNGLAWSQGVFQIGHHSYNPTKDCGTTNHQGFKPCGPDTWHWDNLSISPSKPFTIINADKDYHNIMTASRATFKSPAPANAFLKFQGFDASLKDIEVSFNEGASWIAAKRQAGASDFANGNTSTMLTTNNRGQYFMTIPEGTQTALFRGQQDSNWGASVNNPSIVSLTTVSGGGRTVENHPTSVPLPTASPVPTFTPQPSVNPPTPTAQPSPTRAPTATPTPTTTATEGIVVQKIITKLKNGNIRVQYTVRSQTTQKFMMYGRLLDFSTGIQLKQQLWQNLTVSAIKPLVVNMDFRTNLQVNQVVATSEIYTYHSTQ